MLPAPSDGRSPGGCGEARGSSVVAALSAKHWSSIRPGGPERAQDIEARGIGGDDDDERDQHDESIEKVPPGLDEPSEPRAVEVDQQLHSEHRKEYLPQGDEAQGLR